MSIIQPQATETVAKTAAELPAECCVKCRYYVKSERELNQGLCRRYPPQTHIVGVQTPVGNALSLRADFPPMKADSWCGEFLAVASEEGEL